MATIKNISLPLIRAAHAASSRKSKIVCTLGPSCWSVERLGQLIDNGMSVARFNFSHGDHKTHFSTLERLREALHQRPNSNVAVLLDTKGPEIRTGKVDPAIGKLSLKKGDVIEVGTDFQRLCTRDYLACSYQSLPRSVREGSTILVADGSLSLKVKECHSNSVIAEVMNNASFGDNKNMNLPQCIVDLPTLTSKDEDDLKHFGIKHGIDFIAASFVRKGSDIDVIRGVLGNAGKDIKIIAKIENEEGLANFDDILARADGIMVARGDLGMEIPIEKVFLAQKMMIHKCNIAGKPVITATQMLESMIANPRPTRAECADIANAVLDGSDCLMLSGETANGDYPMEAVQMMASTCLQAESMIDYDGYYEDIRHAMLSQGAHINASESIASSAVKTARDVDATLIIVLTQTGLSYAVL